MTFFSLRLGIFFRPDPRPLIYVCDLHDFVEESTEVIFLWKKTEAKVQNVRDGVACNTCRIMKS